MRILLSDKVVREYVENEGYKLLTQFVNSRDKINLECPNGHQYQTHFDNFKNKGSRCRECKGLNKFTIEQVKKFIEIDSNSGYKLLSNSYENNKSFLTIECEKGHVFEMQYTVFKNQNSRCPKCSHQRTRERLTYSYEYVKNYIEIESNSGYKLLDHKYINTSVKMKMVCNYGHKIEKTFSNFLVGKRCWICHLENNRGENHYSWNSELTNEDRIVGRNIQGYDDWVYSVYERDNYTCQCCGKKSNGDLNAHHLDGYNWCVARRLDVSNGATLCERCHIHFHQNYGYGDNTENQFLYWILSNGNGLYNIDNKRKESVLKNKPEQKEPVDTKKYLRKYYEENSRRYSEKDFDTIFGELILENMHPKFFTTNGFKQITGIHPISVAGVFRMQWVDVLSRYELRDKVYKYVCEEYLRNYYINFSCSFEEFIKKHEFITQDLIKQFTMSQIKESCGFKGSFQQHTQSGYELNFAQITNNLGKVPLLKEFIELTKIPVKSYYNYFNTSSYDRLILNFVTTTIELEQYERDKKDHIRNIASIGGRASGYSDKEKEIEFKRVFDSFHEIHGRYPTRREFSEISKYSEKAYMKKYKISWNQAVLKYGYPIMNKNKKTPT